MALVGRDAGDRVAADADAILAGVGLRAGRAVVAGGAVVHRRMHAGVAHARIRRARIVVVAIGVGVAAVFNRAAADACPIHAGVGIRARVAVAAGGAVILGRVGADAG